MGVVTPDALDVLCHAAVRARNSAVLLASCSDAAALEGLRGLAGRLVALRMRQVRLHAVVAQASGGPVPGLPWSPKQRDAFMLLLWKASNLDTLTQDCAQLCCPFILKQPKAGCHCIIWTPASCAGLCCAGNAASILQQRLFKWPECFQPNPANVHAFVSSTGWLRGHLGAGHKPGAGRSAKG